MATSPLFGRMPRPTLDPARTALLVVDVQRYFVEPEHPFGRQIFQVIPEGAAAYFKRVETVVIPALQGLLAHARDLRARVVFTEFGSLAADGSDLPGWARRHNERGLASVGAVVYPPFTDPICRIDQRVAPLPGELVLQKNSSGPLNASRLDRTLRTLGVDTVIVAGLVTDVCVAQTAREFGDRDFDAIVAEDACATVNEVRHLATLEGLATSFAAVSTSVELVKMLRATQGLTHGREVPG